MVKRSATWLLALATAFPAVAVAQDHVTIYRCTAADGAVTVQNDRPCPPGSDQQKRVMETAPPPPLPPPVPAPPPPSPSPSEPSSVVPLVAGNAASAEAPASTIAVEPPAAKPSAIDPQPPPALYQCRTWDDDTYLSEDATPAKRCAPLRTTGLGGDPRRGAGAACQMTTDQCQPVPDGQLCDQWRERLRQADTALRFGRVDDSAAAQAELERLAHIVFESTCASQ